MERSLYLVAYDVREPSRLRHMLNVLKDYASGGQKSAFECYLFPWERSELISRVEMAMESDEDSFLMVSLAGVNNVKTLGIAVKPADEMFTYLG